MRERWGDTETLTAKIASRHLEWLGHLARMPDHRQPKMCLFSWLPQTRPKGGPRRRWRDLAKTDLKTVGLSDGPWYDKTLDRKQWRDMWKKKLVESHQPQPRGMRPMLLSVEGALAESE